MKTEAFFIWIQDKLLNYPDISLNTVMLFVDSFYNHLSVKERNKHRLSYQIIKEISNKQITLDSFVNKLKIETFKRKLNEIKK